MPTNPLRTALSAVVGLALGYLVWLGGTAIVLATTPVRYWAISVAILLAVLTAASFVSAVQNKQPAKAMAFWLAPVLPILVSLYMLIVFVT
ncbi:CHASE2 domain-containing sensor protein [Mycolicibacterium sp. BK556]|uniref:hypothetical protein n=1 Tax=Mycobacteriaceae TaxID=1762 RepID=UPI001061FD6B|nr:MULTISPECIES: hypothetical protein [Mycobacteriaceae]MBB3601386.1 CHASE2 domain-containing sensor protein [Mycolicibacterium sp. BK556]MBB3631138.1 CHASE2 domain-containing sensor protein [Mycolicibacterium sp. BK607]MBB3749140.1 CHASE2 domain-containing sensor protein [Mycolicibacterium sp. BK634]TDO14649.1 hypothetical protein EV580_2782 [Mycobacterium sp. BK086]